MDFTITTLTLFFLFSAVPSNAQLNYEGNPLTENTEYTAEETHSVERNSRTSQQENTETVLVNNVPQKLYPVYAKDASQPDMRTVTINNSTYSIQQSVEVDPKQLQTRNFETRNPQDNSLIYNSELMKTDFLQPQQHYMSDYALNTFLQSKTPEESKVALEYYLKSTSNQVDPVQTQVVNNELIQQSLPYHTSNTDFHQNNLPYNQVLSLQSTSGSEMVQSNPPVNIQPSYLSNENFQPGPNTNLHPSSSMNNQPTMAPVYQPAAVPNYQPLQYQANLQPNVQPNLQSNLQQNFQPNLQPNPQPNFQPNPQPNLQPIVQPTLQSQPVQPSYQFEPNPVRSHPPPHQGYQNLGEPMPMYQQPRVPFKYGPNRFSRFPARPRLRSKIPQQRIGPAVMYKNPGPVGPTNFASSPVLSKPPKGVELIYTKPPGYRAPIRQSPPGPYEQASSWYPEVGRLPSASQKDIYWSQLYQQSYDPHYYNYIAKTGKIKPHLYGKLGDRAEDEGILSDMIKGFKKHGLKNIMNPGFLLGMTIPALTLMLTALVQKRSLARADFAPPSLDQQKLDEYMAKLQIALRTYDEDNKRATTKLRRRRR